MHKLLIIASVGLASIFVTATIVSSNDEIMAVSNPKYALFQTNGNIFVLTEPLRYKIESTNEMITVPAGFVTDFASVPQLAQSIVSVVGKHTIPALLHDYLYWEQACTRKQADAILAEAMKEYKSSWFDINAVYYAVRAAGKTAWKQNKADRANGFPRLLQLPSKPSNADCFAGGLPPNLDWGTYRKLLFESGLRAEPLPQSRQRPAYCTLK